VCVHSSNLWLYFIPYNNNIYIYIYHQIIYFIPIFREQINDSESDILSRFGGFECLGDHGKVQFKMNKIRLNLLSK